ncbi:phosphotransferase [Sphingomonas colocasiae]|uniref:Phosphotransferase n=1 Tax=Sphingomonas colocasiae TaxID=1848973 RepID=A0ABS7PSM8_9SPHN|nr:phosphotransferase [Sphingomonas colocasiae]MBY8824349.1 phosphotransferase [Sphingomonas colocasiae]
MDSQELNSGTTAVRDAHRFDEVRLDEWMRANVEGYAGPLTVTQFKGGQSNPTYKLSTPGRDYVMRRKPPGKLAAGAHAIEREVKVIRAVGATGFPAAHIHGLCTENSVIGTWFYVMECVQGRIIWDTAFPDVPREERPAYFDAMNVAIAQLHSLDPAAVGLADFGKAGNYFDRQISRWSRQYQADHGEAGREPMLERLIDWLPRNIPAGDETRIVHGDFRCDNMVFHPTEPKIVAVLDWELSTLGHPLADFCYHLMMFRMPPMVIAGLVGTDLTAANIPSEAEYVAAYCRRTGRDDIPPADLRFYIAFNMFRLAAIIHGIKARAVRGTASSAHAAEMVKSLEPLAALAWQQTEAV